MTRTLLAISVALIASVGAMTVASAEPPKTETDRQSKQPPKKLGDGHREFDEVEQVAGTSMRAGQAGPAGRQSGSRPRVEAREPAQIPEGRSQRPMPCLASAISGNWSLEGTLIAPDQVIPQGIITIAGKRIASIKAIRGGRLPSCSTKIDGIILPGLIDLHNHLTWNVHPRWQPPKQYSNREEWRLSAEHQDTLARPQDELVSGARLGCEANLYGEVKAIAGGATTAVGGLDIQRYLPEGRCVTGLIRNLDYDSQFSPLFSEQSYLHATQNLGALIDLCSGQSPDGNPIIDVAVNVIFPLGGKSPTGIIPQLSPTRVEYFKCHLATGKLRSLLVHLAEGKSSDRATRQEFAELQALGLLREGLIIIHGTALQPREFAAMKSSGAGLVWSPRSNMELYGATLDIAAVRNAGVTIAIAPDWSPTGSGGMLQELNYARANFSDFDSQQLTTMATSVPARLARVEGRIGQLKAGLYADLLVLRRKDGSAYNSVVTASPADVELVVVGGRPVYGDSVLMQQLAPNKKLTLMTICGASKAIDLGDTIAAQSSWDAVKAKLQERLSQGTHPTSLGPFECPRALRPRLPEKIIHEGDRCEGSGCGNSRNDFDGAP
jgi:5-methylthioadenosine/S-adenosylhomocysteine deaminase